MYEVRDMKKDEKMFGQESVRDAIKRISRERLDARANEFVGIYELFDRIREKIPPTVCDNATFGKALWCVFSGNRKWTSPEGADVTEVLGSWRYAGDVIAKKYGGDYMDYYCCTAFDSGCHASVVPVFDEIKTLLENWGFVEGEYGDDAA